MKRVPVKLIERYGSINAGETAGFSRDVARGLVQSGIAVYVQPEDDDAASPPADQGGDQIAAEGEDGPGNDAPKSAPLPVLADVPAMARADLIKALGALKVRFRPSATEPQLRDLLTAELSK